ncbi:11892_t:CDS:2, partial [Gigaspora rosea]
MIALVTKSSPDLKTLVVVEKQTLAPNYTPVGRTIQCAQEYIDVSYADNAKIANFI